MSAEAAKLVKIAKDNPWHLFTQEELALILGVSRQAIAEMKKAGAPFVVDKSHPDLIKNWIGENAQSVGKTS